MNIKEMSFKEIEDLVLEQNSTIEKLKEKTSEAPQTGINIPKKEFKKIETALKKSSEVYKMLQDLGIIDCQDETTIKNDDESISKELDTLLSEENEESKEKKEEIINVMQDTEDVDLMSALDDL